MSPSPRFRLVAAATSPLVELAARGRGPQAVAVLGRPEKRLSAPARATADSLGVNVERRLERASAKHSAGEVVELQVDVPEGEPGAQVEALLVAGVGDGDALGYRRAGAALARRCRERRLVTVELPVRRPELLRAFVEGWGLASYTFSRRSKSEDGESARPGARTVELVVPGSVDDLADALHRATVTVDAVRLARDLTSTPSNEKSPAWLAGRAQRLGAARSARLRVRVRDERELARQGFDGILAVGSGSVRPPRLVELRYAPAGADSSTPHVVLVGKGITFDTGGLSLKPPDGMTAMKTDMAGGAAVLAVMSALADLDVRVRVTGLVAAAENMPSGTAQRPGDVIEHYGGKTVEVLNTDAEGRLVLADALAYADARLDPDVLVDVATLTGAATLGLGRRHAAMFTPDDRLARSISRAAEQSGEQVWRLPLVEDYRASLDSDVADLAHVSQDKNVHGGAITAALFLREFVGERPWVHLDIAGTGRADSDFHEVTKGATGWGARTLLRWLETQ